MEYLEEVAVQTARAIAEGTLKVDRKKSLTDKAMNFALGFDWVKDQIFQKAKGQVMKLTGGLYPAPLKVCTVDKCIFLFFPKAIQKISELLFWYGLIIYLYWSSIDS